MKNTFYRRGHGGRAVTVPAGSGRCRGPLFKIIFHRKTISGEEKKKNHKYKFIIARVMFKIQRECAVCRFRVSPPVGIEFTRRATKQKKTPKKKKINLIFGGEIRLVPPPTRPSSRPVIPTVRLSGRVG